MILSLKDAPKAQKNDIFKTISSQISQNTLIISSIISNFWPIIKCDFDPKSCSKGSKNDALKTCANNIWHFFNSPPPLPPPYESRFPSQNTLIISSIISNFWPIIKCDFDPKSCFKIAKNDALKTCAKNI